MKYAWIRQQQDSYPVDIVCDVLGVSRSGYYAWLDREPSARTQRRQQIGQAVRQSHQTSHGIYGYRRVHEDLVNLRRVAQNGTAIFLNVRHNGNGCRQTGFE